MNSGGFAPFPWPFSAIVPQQAERVVEQTPPQRVKVAMEYLYYLAGKTTDKAAPHGLGCEVIDGQKLAPAEIDAQTAACHLLRNYFRGDLKPDWYEQVEEEEQEQAQMNGPGRLLACFLCQAGEGSKVNPNCPLCHGQGQVLIFPGDGR